MKNFKLFLCLLIVVSVFCSADAEGVKNVIFLIGGWNGNTSGYSDKSCK